MLPVPLGPHRPSISKTQKQFAAQQFLSYQGKDTELFIDLHPPKSFNMIRLIHQNDSIQQPIGSLVCQIFAGLLSKQISKNILVVGSGSNVQSIEKTLLVQAIAGETELKIITDNAYRYAMVYRGVAVGIKLLRDVFDSLALHTPCLFLIEDIHAIGERRPLLISDDDNTKGNSSTVFGSQREEIHEKNQVLYQLSKQQITNYRKPYKGDLSLSESGASPSPTNHFCFDLFRGHLTEKSLGNFQISRPHPYLSSDLSKTQIKSFGSIFGDFLNKKRLLSPKIIIPFKYDSEKSPKETSGSETRSSLLPFNKSPFAKSSNTSSSMLSNNELDLASRLLVKSSELLAPPATSPFSVLTLKEDKKFKPYKVVSEMPWSGLPSEQLSQLSKASYSIRVKVALLADMAISSLTIKLDIITDLLVIMDSVKGNRGFVVFATTHVPYILDPALRRPGRLDETITLGLFPTLLCRWEILKSSFGLFHLFNTKGFNEHLGYSKGFSLDFTFSLSSNIFTSFFSSGVLSPSSFGGAGQSLGNRLSNSNFNIIQRKIKNWISNHYQGSPRVLKTPKGFLEPAGTLN